MAIKKAFDSENSVRLTLLKKCFLEVNNIYNKIRTVIPLNLKSKIISIFKQINKIKLAS